MKKSTLVIGAVLLSAFAASAADWSPEEGFLGYSFVRFKPDSPFVPSFNANGGDGQFVYNVNKWIGGVVDIGAVTKGTLNQATVDTTVLNFVAGPRVTWHNESRFQPFGQVLFGGAYSTFSTQISVLGGEVVAPHFILENPNLPITTRLVASRTGFAMLAGGGLDIKINKHIAFRPVGADYFLTRIPTAFTGSHHRNVNNFRYTAGVNFLFGEK